MYPLYRLQSYFLYYSFSPLYSISGNSIAPKPGSVGRSLLEVFVCTKFRDKFLPTTDMISVQSRSDWIYWTDRCIQQHGLSNSLRHSKRLPPPRTLLSFYREQSIFYHRPFSSTVRFRYRCFRVSLATAWASRAFRQKRYADFY